MVVAGRDLALACGLRSAAVPAQVGDPFLDQPPVDFQLFFAGTAHATPIFMRERWVHIRFSRGSEYSNCANSTANRASCVRAWEAKISRISSVRSMTLTSSAFSRLRV